MSKDRKIYFLARLPRSRLTQLADILARNMNVYVDHHDGVNFFVTRF